MRLILFLVGGLVFANIISATFIWPAEKQAADSPPIVNTATLQGQDPWLASEKSIARGRDNFRRGMQKILDKPWAAHCTPDGHQELINAVNNYYYLRNSEIWSKVNTYGEQARAFAIKVWATADDNRIERLIGDTYSRGYFVLGELERDTRKAVNALVQGEQPRARPCAG